MAEVIATAPSLRGSEPGEDEAISEPRLLPPHYRRTSRRCFGTLPRNDGVVAIKVSLEKSDKERVVVDPSQNGGYVYGRERTGRLGEY